MHRTIRGFAIAGIVLSVILGLGALITGMVFIAGAEDILKNAMKDAETWKAFVDAKLTTVDAVKELGIKILAPGIVLLVGVAADIFMLVVAARPEPKRVLAIVAGALGIVFGELFTTIAGIISIVHGAKDGK